MQPAMTTMRTDSLCIHGCCQLAKRLTSNCTGPRWAAEKRLRALALPCRTVFGQARLHEEHDRHISLLAELKKRDAGVLVRLVPQLGMVLLNTT